MTSLENASCAECIAPSRYEAACEQTCDCLTKPRKDSRFLTFSRDTAIVERVTNPASFSVTKTPFELLSSVYHNMDSKSDPSSDRLPSYSESVRSPQQHSSPNYLPQNIAAARSASISSLITAFIIPHLHGNALSGLASTTLILIPSNVSSLQPPSKISPNGPSESIVGFPSAENLTVVRLHGQENSLEFWRQSAVMQELGLQMRTHLQNSGHRVIRDDETSLQGPNSPNANWRTVQKDDLGNGEVRIRVETMDVCIRTENDMGLYETRTGKALNVKVDVGG